MKDCIVVILADGFEEIEAVTPIDVLRRIGVNVITAGINSLKVTSSHNIEFKADVILSEILEAPKGVILPGGMPGAVNLKNDSNVIELITKTAKAGKLTAAICASTIVLNEAKLIENKNVTAYPSFKSHLTQCNYTGAMVEIDGNIITGKGPGASFKFAKAIAEFLGKTEEVEKIQKAMLF